MIVLRIATLAWGIASILVAFAMTRVSNVLDAWFQMSGLLSGGVLGLFLLGLFSKRADSTAALIAVSLGLIVLFVLGMPQIIELPAAMRLQVHTSLAIVFGTLTIFFTGVIISAMQRLPSLNISREEIHDQ
jgi:SSS family solute:Na+ symporter